MTKIELPISKAKGEYHGMALSAVLDAIPSETVKNKVLLHVGMRTIDPNKWYDLDTARIIYFSIENVIGLNTIEFVGQNIIKNAKFPDEMHNTFDALKSIQAAYENSVRGTDLGEIAFTQTGEDSAVMVFSTPFSCNLDIGIMKGCAIKFGNLLEVTHDHGSCRTNDGFSCTYHLKVIPVI